jgi:hypothetical protein
MSRVQRFATGPVIVVLALFAVYTLYAATRAVVTAEGYDPAVFWTSITAMYLIAATATWCAFHLYRIRKNRGRGPLTNG